MKKNVISFMNMKGGVGKTTICVNIAGQLANDGRKVLIIDNDPQMNASQYLIEPEELESLLYEQKTIYALYKSEVEDDLNDMSGDDDDDDVDVDIIKKNAKPNIDIICGDLNMTKVKDDGDISDILSSYILNNKLSDNYDFIFIDCPPTQSIYTMSAFKASNFYVLVIKPDYLSTIGLSLFNRMLNKYNKKRMVDDKLQGLGIIANLTQKTSDKYHENKIQEIKDKYKFKLEVFDCKVSNISAIAKASEKQNLMYETSGCKKAIKKLTTEFIKRYNERMK